MNLRNNKLIFDAIDKAVSENVLNEFIVELFNLLNDAEWDTDFAIKEAFKNIK